MRQKQINYNELSFDKLTEYISRKHNAHLKEMIETLAVHLKTMLKIDVKIHPEVEQLGKSVTRLRLLLEDHLYLEEKILFPYIRTMMKATKESAIQPGHLAENLLIKVKEEHAGIMSQLLKLRKVSRDYTPSVNSSPSLKLSYAQMFELEQDLHRHIFVEEQILFPKVIEFEKRTIKSISK